MNVIDRGMIIGMELEGAIFLKQEYDKLFFEIPSNTISDKGLRIASKAFKDRGYKLMIKKKLKRKESKI